MARRRRKHGIALPWERRGSLLRDILAGRRWKMLVLMLAAAGLLALLWRTAQHHARVRETRIAIAEVQRAIAAFRADLGRCPESVGELLHPPAPAHQYLQQAPSDGWGRTLWVQCPARFDPHSAEVVSAGPSGSFHVDDNVR